MTLREASDALGVKVRTLREWIRLGKIKATKSESGYRWEIDEADVKERVGNDNKD